MSAYSRRKRAGKRPKPKAKPERRIVPAGERRAAVAPPPRREPRILPWEGGGAPDHYDYSIARMMQEIPGR